MTKKVMALLMAALLMLALAGCGENKNNTNRPGSRTSANQPRSSVSRTAWASAWNASSAASAV